MTPPSLSLARFSALVEAYGIHFERWPEGERAQARALLLSSVEARAVFEAQRELDGLLDADVATALPADLEAKLVAIPSAHRRPLPFRSRALLWPAFGWAAAAVLGVWLGTSGAPVTGEDQAVADIAAQTAGQPSADAASDVDEDAQFLALAAGSLTDYPEAP